MRSPQSWPLRFASLRRRWYSPIPTTSNTASPAMTHARVRVNPTLNRKWQCGQTFAAPPISLAQFGHVFVSKLSAITLHGNAARRSTSHTEGNASRCVPHVYRSPRDAITGNELTISCKAPYGGSIPPAASIEKPRRNAGFLAFLHTYCTSSSASTYRPKLARIGQSWPRVCTRCVPQDTRR